MPLQLQTDSAAIVILGNFNPSIFHPIWFADNELIRRQEADAAEIEIVHREVAAFSTGWLQINSTKERFQVSTTQDAYYEPLRDLVLGVLDLLSHTPLEAVGLNRQLHYLVRSEQYWHEIGHRLAPKDDWEDLLKQPGMRQLVMEGQRSDGYDGYVRVHVEPSTQIEHGIYIMINDHYQLKTTTTRATTTKTARDIIGANWTKSLEADLKIANRIANLGEHQ